MAFKTFTRRRLLAVGMMVGMFALSTAGQAADYPSRAVRFVNPNPAGGSGDLVARSFAAELSKNLGQAVFVDNRPGAGSTLGGREGAKAAADGYTITLTSSPMFSVVPLVYSKLDFDPIKDFRSIIVLASFENVLVANPSVPVKNIKELIALATEKPGELTYGSSGNGTTTHLSAEAFKQDAGVSIEHIPYSGGAPALSDLLGGHIDMIFNNIPSALPHIKTGALNAIAVTSSVRSPLLPNVPTVDEAGLKGFEAVGWFSISVPAATPQEVVDTLSAASMKAVESPEFIQLMKENGFTVVGGTPEQMDTMIQNEVKRWEPVVKATGLQID